MKKVHIAAIIVIALVIGTIISTFGEAGTYASFNEAFAEPEEEFHVVGKLVKDKDMIYQPEVNPDLFVFSMVDEEGREQQVHLHKSKPQDFERSEQIVLIGQAKGDEFHANQILMKCPSKYQDGTPEFKTPEEMEAMDMEQANL